MRGCLGTLVLGCMVLVTSAAVADAQPSKRWDLPTINLAVAYRQFEDGKLGSLVWQGQLYCRGDSCELITAALNWCLPLSSAKEQFKGFELGLTRVGTDDGSLEIVMFHCEGREGSIVVKKQWLGAEITYRFGFSVADCRKPGMITRVTSFDGAGIQPNADQVETWTLVPFKGEFVRWTPDCPLILPSVAQ